MVRVAELLNPLTSANDDVWRFWRRRDKYRVYLVTKAALLRGRERNLAAVRRYRRRKWEAAHASKE